MRPPEGPRGEATSSRLIDEVTRARVEASRVQPAIVNLRDLIVGVLAGGAVVGAAWALQPETTPTSTAAPPATVDPPRTPPQVNPLHSFVPPTRNAPPIAVVQPAPAPPSEDHVSDLEARLLNTAGEGLLEARDGVIDLLGGPDEEIEQRLFGDDPRHERTTEVLQWHREQAGACAAPEPIVVEGPTTARFRAACAHGRLEFLIAVRDPEQPKVSSLKIGNLDREPEEKVAVAANAAVALIGAWSDERYAELFAAGFRERHPAQEFRSWLEGIAEPGPCAIEQTDRVGPGGALFVLACGELRRTLAIGLNDEDKLSRFGVRRLFSDPNERPDANEAIEH